MWLRWVWSLLRREEGQFIVTNPPPPPPGLPSNYSPPDGSTGQSTTVILSWSAATGATGYDVKFGTTFPLPLVSSNQSGLTYNPGTTSANTTYHWEIIARNSSGINGGPNLTYQTASAVTGQFYVSTTGSDSNSGLNPIDQAWLTIGHALPNLVAGNVLNVRAGTYLGQANAIDSNLYSIASGTVANPIIIQQYPPDISLGLPIIRVGVNGQNGAALVTQHDIIIDHIMLDGLGQVNASEADYHGGLFIGATATRITFQNGEIKGSPGQGVLVEGQGNTIQNTHVHHNGSNTLQQTHNIYFANSNNVCQGCEVDHGSSCGVQSYDTGNHPANNIIRKNFVHDNGVFNPVAEIFVSYGANSLIYDNIIVHASNFIGIDADFGAPNLTNTLIYNNTLLCGGIQIGAASSGAQVKNNIVRTYGNAGVGTISDTGSGTVQTANFTSDPLFVNVGTGNYHLQAGSGAIDAGVTLSQVPDDYDGVTRPQGSAYDIGAYER